MFFSPVEYSQVDWHEFVLVETITFRENETGVYGCVWVGGGLVVCVCAWMHACSEPLTFAASALCIVL